MKRLLMLGALLLAVLSMSGCFLIVGDAWTRDIEYVARNDNFIPGDTMDITINDENGHTATFSNVAAAEWRRSFTVSNMASFLAFVQAQGPDIMTVEIRVDGSTRTTATDAAGPLFVASASLLVK